MHLRWSLHALALICCLLVPITAVAQDASTGLDNTWELYRLEGGHIVDHLQLSADQLALPQLVLTCLDGRVLEVLVALRPTATDRPLPQFPAGTPYFFANVDGVGYLGVAQHTPGEEWLFRLGRVFVYKRFPAQQRQYDVAYEISNADGDIVGAGEFGAGSDYYTRAFANTESGRIISREYYVGPAAAWEEVDAGWRTMGWFEVPLPAAAGRFLYWPAFPGGSVKVTVDGVSYTAQIPAAPVADSASPARATE